MTLKSDAKFKEKRTCSFKHDIRSLFQNWHEELGELSLKYTQKSTNLYFDGLFLSKA